MSTVLELTKPKISKNEVLYGVSWEVYEKLLQDYWEMPSPRFTYDSGILEVVMPNSSSHEADTFILTQIVVYIAGELEIDFRNFGSTTFRRKIFRKGFEPDSCFYIQSLALIEGKSNLGRENEIPPDLIIEVNRTSSSVPRMPIFAAFGVKEVWRFDGKKVKFYTLEEGIYLEIENSIALPVLSGKKATEFLRESRDMKSSVWAKRIRDWAKTPGEIER